MAIILPSMNTIWFWFDKKDRRRLHGTPHDVMRKFDVFTSRYKSLSGLEIFLIPERLENVEQFSSSFYRTYSKLDYKSLHIGDLDPDFLHGSEAISEKLELLSKILDRMETSTIIFHAHHLRHHRQKTRRLLLSILPGVQFCIENNGFDDEWGARIENLVQIFNECPEFGFCLDIAHVKDFSGQCKLSDFIEHPILASRLKEIHFSYSTRNCVRDPYMERGYPGYGPYHALFSVLGAFPSVRTREFSRNHPVVLEGIAPKEGKNLDFLKQEAKLLDRWEGP